MDGRAGTTVVSGEAGGPIVVVVVWLVVVWCALVVRRLRIDVMLACAWGTDSPGRTRLIRPWAGYRYIDITLSYSFYRS